jgi:hypothetical protein
MAIATLNSITVTHASVQIPAWGAWYADVTLDRESDLTSQRVTLVLGGLTLSGFALSGGSFQGRSRYRIVGGAGGLGREIARRSYANDAGVKRRTLLEDMARDAGETWDSTTLPAATDRVGNAWVRQAGPARATLEALASRFWHVGTDGQLRLGTRASTTFAAKHAVERADIALGIAHIAADDVSTLLPGASVAGLVAADVEHTIDERGLRSTVYGRASTSRRLSAYAEIQRAVDPRRDYRGCYEYRVVSMSGRRANLQSVRVSTGMPDLARVTLRPGVAGIRCTPLLGSRVLVAFVDADPSRPVVVSFEGEDDNGFTGTLVELTADTMVGGEHVATAEATALMIYNSWVSLLSLAGGGPLLAAVLQPLLGTAILTALTAQGAPAPPGLPAQVAASAAQIAGFATGMVPATTSAYFAPALASLATKTPNVSGLFPGLGSRAVKAG